MLKRVIFNADDFGLSSGVNRAIIESHRNGVVNSTTILGNCDEKLLIEAADLAKQNPKLGVGVHLVLTTRAPLVEGHKSLVDEHGFFKYTGDTLDDKIDLDEVYVEWKAQIIRIKEHFEITHLDSHHHVHLDDRIYKVVKRLSREFKLPIRSVRSNTPTEIKANLGFYEELATMDYLFETMSIFNGLLEIMVHPGSKDDTFLEEISRYNNERYEETLILTDKRLQDFLKKNKIKNINYSHFKMR